MQTLDCYTTPSGADERKSLVFFFLAFLLKKKQKNKTVASSSAAVRGVCRNVELDKYTHIKQTQTFTLDAHTSARPTVRAKTHGPLSCFRKGLCGGGLGV